MNMMFQNNLQDSQQLKTNQLTGVTKVSFKEISNTTSDASSIELHRILLQCNFIEQYYIEHDS